MEALAFISTEVHKGFKRFFTRGASDCERSKAGQAITRRLEFIANALVREALTEEGLD
jgi:glutathione S-transferase